MSDPIRTPLPSSATPISPHVPSSNTAAVVTLAAETGLCHVVSQVTFSYDGTPTGGSLTIAHGPGPTTKFSVPVTSGGVGPISFNPPLKFPSGEAVVCTLAAGGSGVSGRLNVNAHTESP